MTVKEFKDIIETMSGDKMIDRKGYVLGKLGSSPDLVIKTNLGLMGSDEEKD